MNMQNYGTTINDNIHEISNNNNKEYSWLNEYIETRERKKNKSNQRRIFDLEKGMSWIFN